MISTDGAHFARFLLTDPVVLGVVAWAGLVVTVAGFSIAIVQLGVDKALVALKNRLLAM